MPTLKRCQEHYDNLLPDDPDEEAEREARRLARVEEQIDEWESRRRDK